MKHNYDLLFICLCVSMYSYINIYMNLCNYISKLSSSISTMIILPLSCLGLPSQMLLHSAEQMVRGWESPTATPGSIAGSISALELSPHISCTGRSQRLKVARLPRLVISVKCRTSLSGSIYRKAPHCGGQQFVNIVISGSSCPSSSLSHFVLICISFRKLPCAVWLPLPSSISGINYNNLSEWLSLSWGLLPELLTIICQ